MILVDPLGLKIPEEFGSERLTIRAPRVCDAAELNSAICESIEELRPWICWAKTAPSVEETKAFLRKARRNYRMGRVFRLNIFLKGTGTIVGGAVITNVDLSVPKVEIGYWARTTFAGQGYITEAVNAITEFAIRNFGARRIELRMNDKNERSWRLAERCGYELEGILRCHSRGTDGELRDMRVYAKVFDLR